MTRDEMVDDTYERFLALEKVNDELHDMILARTAESEELEALLAEGEEDNTRLREALLDARLDLSPTSASMQCIDDFVLNDGDNRRADYVACLQSNRALEKCECGLRCFGSDGGGELRVQY